MRAATIVFAAAAALSLAGCAVLTVDVDVYKGALANHESVQIGQVAAMAMGAKPLLAELRHKLEQEACYRKLQVEEDAQWLLGTKRPVNDDHPSLPTVCTAYVRMQTTANFISDTGALSRDTARVNAILSLYEERGDAGDTLLRPLRTRLYELETHSAAAKRLTHPYVATAPNDKARDERRSVLSREALRRNRDTGHCRSNPNDCPHGLTDEHVTALQRAYRAAGAAWTEAMHLLTSVSYRTRLEKLNPGALNALDAVAWVAATLTSMEGLERARAEQSPVFGKDAADDFRKVLAFGHIDEGAAVALSQVLQDAERGLNRANELLVANRRAELDRKTWSIVVYASPKGLQRAESTSEQSRMSFQYLRETADRAGDTGLGKGRQKDGLEALIKAYLDANASAGRASNAHDVADKRRRLLDGLVNFAEKVSIIGNFDPLVRGVEPGEEQNVFRSSSTDKYVRVLQAVGNSIISQVDALAQKSAHHRRVTDGQATELIAIRNAEARAAAVIKHITAELATMSGFPDETLILAKLQAAQPKLDELVQQLQTTLTAQRSLLAGEGDTARKWRAGFDVARRKEMENAVVAYGTTNASVTVQQVAAEMVRLMKQWEAEARLPSGAGDEEARRLQTAQTALGDAKFTGDTANPGPARDKYLAIVRTLGADCDAAEKVEKNRAGTVDVLTRWHRAATLLSGGAAPRLLVPDGMEKGAGTATDVLDVMLTTLKYEHVDAVLRDRNSELAKNRLAAVELLYAYRSGMIHIRPASTFLRNSYPATALQQDPTAGVWRNMLGDHAARQLPGYEWFESEKENAKINRTIDKQFWQRVNQVRLAGVGNTNYALAKDDVGNWYVKSYTADPNDVIKSAKSLAMYAAGPAMGANFLARGGAATTQPLEAARQAAPAAPGPSQPAGDATQVSTRPSPVVTTEPARSTLGRQFDRYETKYAKDTRDSRAKLKGDLDGLSTVLRKAAGDEGVPETELVKLDGAKVFAVPAFTELGNDKNAKGETKSVSELNKDIAGALRAIKQYRNEVPARIGKATGLAATDGEKAKLAVDRIVRDLLTRYLKERETSAAVYESAILFIGETAGF